MRLPFRLPFFFISLCLLAACAPQPLGTRVEPLDLARSIIFYNGNVVTMEAGQPSAQALALQMKPTRQELVSE